MRTIRDPPKGITLDWQQLLHDAVHKPGLISSAYSAFHNFSIGNVLWACMQCQARGLELGPLHTFKGWLRHERFVRKGERALTLVMPITLKRRLDQPCDSEVADDPSADSQSTSRTMFVERPFWFTLSQTDGKSYTPLSIPYWDEEVALRALGVIRELFANPDGNCQGYAYGRTISVSPLAFLPHRTLFHECAHVLLGHTTESQNLSDDDAPTPRDLREVEAECVAMLCCCSLNLPGEEFSRGYIQKWYQADSIPERSVQRIFKSADALLKAGVSPVTTSEADAPVE